MKAEIKKTLKYIVIKLLMTKVQKRQISFWQRAELEYRTIVHSLYSRDQKETHTVDKKLAFLFNYSPLERIPGEVIINCLQG